MGGWMPNDQPTMESVEPANPFLKSDCYSSRYVRQVRVYSTSTGNSKMKNREDGRKRGRKEGKRKYIHERKLLYAFLYIKSIWGFIPL